jgi:small subunit ribosomal protein S5|tara:strand:+ start:428 stop:946 length:519 start_codon:yes stop_codon:yes gene_type:complete
MVTSTNRDGRRGNRSRNNEEKSPYTEKVVSIRRVSKVVKGGRNLSFAAFVVIGDEKGKIGVGSGKAAAVPDAVRKAVSAAKKDLKSIIMKGTTVPHEVIEKFGAAKVMIRPASQGTGIIAGGGVRAVMEVVGIKDVISKSHGSSNTINVVKASVKALMGLKDLDEQNEARKQ